MRKYRKYILLVIMAIVLAACGGNEFGTVGNKFDKEKDASKIVEGNYMNGYFKEENGKKGYVFEEKIAIPAVFDNLTGLARDQEGKSLFIVDKEGKKGVVRAFDKGYIVPCEYEKIDATPAKNFLYLQKPGESMKTYCLDTGKKWEGDEKWPPKEFPADVPFKVLSDLQYWKIESITCLGRGDKPGFFAFKAKGTGLGDPDSNIFSTNSFTFYPEEEGSTRINGSLGATYIFPKTKKGEPFEFDFVGLWDNYCQDIKFVGFLISK